MMTSLALPCLRVLRVCLYPSTYLPDFMTSARRELMDSAVFFCFFWATIFVFLEVDGNQLKATPEVGLDASFSAKRYREKEAEREDGERRTCTELNVGAFYIQCRSIFY